VNEVETGHQTPHDTYVGNIARAWPAGHVQSNVICAGFGHPPGERSTVGPRTDDGDVITSVKCGTGVLCDTNGDPFGRRLRGDEDARDDGSRSDPRAGGTGAPSSQLGRRHI